ncbi:MAG: hypothetical protein WCO21_00945 [bacterium]
MNRDTEAHKIALLHLRRAKYNEKPRMPNARYCVGCGAPIGIFASNNAIVAENLCYPCEELRLIGILK